MLQERVYHVRHGRRVYCLKCPFRGLERRGGTSHQMTPSSTPSVLLLGEWLLGEMRFTTLETILEYFKMLDTKAIVSMDLDCSQEIAFRRAI